MRHSKDLRFFLLICVLAKMIFSCSGGGGSDPSSTGTVVPQTTGTSVTQTVDSEGGNVSHTLGFTIDFYENSVPGPTDIFIEDVTNHSSLPSGITASSKAFKAGPEGIEFDVPVKVTFSRLAADINTDISRLGIFRWNGSDWTALGTFVEDDKLSAYTTGFSIFVAGKPEDIWKKFEFVNYGTEPANLIPWTWTLRDSLFDPYPFRISIHVPGAPYNQTRPTVWLPQGCYTFCYDFDLYEYNTWNWIEVHNFKGTDTPVWDTCLSASDSLAVPPLVSIDTTYGYNNGLCANAPGPDGSSSGPGGTSGCANIGGSWNLTIKTTEKSILDDGTIWGPDTWTNSVSSFVDQKDCDFSITGLPEVINGSINGNTISGNLPWVIDNDPCPPIGLGGTASENLISLSGSGTCVNNNVGQRWEITVVITMSP